MRLGFFSSKNNENVFPYLDLKNYVQFRSKSDNHLDKLPKAIIATLGKITTYSKLYNGFNFTSKDF